MTRKTLRLSLGTRIDRKGSKVSKRSLNTAKLIKLTHVLLVIHVLSALTSRGSPVQARAHEIPGSFDPRNFGPDPRTIQGLSRTSI